MSCSAEEGLGVYDVFYSLRVTMLRSVLFMKWRKKLTLSTQS